MPLQTFSLNCFEAMHFLLSKENIFYAKLKKVHCLVNELHDQEHFQSILTNHKCCHKFIGGTAFFKERFCVQQMMRASEFKMIIERRAIEVKKDVVLSQLIPSVKNSMKISIMDANNYLNINTFHNFNQVQMTT